MKHKVIIESEFKHSANIYQIEIYCSKYGCKIAHTAYANKADAKAHAEWLIKYKHMYSDDYGIIYDTYIRELTLFA